MRFGFLTFALAIFMSSCGLCDYIDYDSSSDYGEVDYNSDASGYNIFDDFQWDKVLDTSLRSDDNAIYCYSGYSWNASRPFTGGLKRCSSSYYEACQATYYPRLNRIKFGCSYDGCPAGKGKCTNSTDYSTSEDDSSFSDASEGFAEDVGETCCCKGNACNGNLFAAKNVPPAKPGVRCYQGVGSPSMIDGIISGRPVQCLANVTVCVAVHDVANDMVYYGCPVVKGYCSLNATVDSACTTTTVSFNGAPESQLSKQCCCKGDACNGNFFRSVNTTTSQQNAS
jgi:hypothetical protein